MANFLKSLFIKGVEIDTTGASNGNVLSYNGTKFAPAAPGSGSLALDDLSDVVVTSPEEFQGISYNGTSWVNGYIPLVSYVRNAETTTLTTGTCVYLYGSTGDHATVKRADNTSDTTSSKTIGVVGASITASNNGPVITRGYVDGIDLSTGYTAGDVLWLGTNGAFTKTKPTAPNHLVFIGVVVRATNNGIIYVATQNGYELDEIHNVSLPNPQSGEFLKYNGSLWVSDAIDLGTDTTGSYVASLVAGTGISLANNSGEGATPTITNTGVTSINTTLTGAVTGIVTTADTGTVTSAMIADGTIVNGDINASAGIALSKLASGTSGQVVIANGTGVPTYTTISGDITISSTGVATIAADSVALGTDTTGNYMSGISGTSPVSVSHTPSEGSSATVSLASGYGDTQNPYDSKTANYFLAAPNGSAGAPTFRAVVAADIPTLNQNTTGTAANITASSNTTLTSLSNLTTVGTLSSLSVSGDLAVDTNVLYVNATLNRVGINVTPQYALDVIGEVSVQSSSWDQDGIRLQGRAGGTSNYDVILTPTTLSATRTLTLPDVTGTVITTGNLSSITTVGTLSAGSIPATLLTGTVASARISGSYTGITAIGTLSSLTVDGANSAAISIGDWSWPGNAAWSAIESNRGYVLLGHPSATGGIYLRSLSTDTPVRIGANHNDTLVVGYNSSYALHSATIDGLAFCNNWWRSTGTSGWYNETYGGGIWMSDSTWIRTYGSKRFVAESGLNVNGTAVTSEPLVVTGNGRVTDSLFFTNYIVADDGVASSGQAAQWLGAFGNWYLVRNSSTLRDKENIQSLGSILTAEMVDDIEVKLWSRKNASGIPEVGPIAEEMDAVSPFLSVRAMDLDENGNVVATEPEGINQNGWLSLLTVALQDAREQIRDLTARIAVLESN